MAATSDLRCEFFKQIAIISMDSGENRLNPKFIDDFNHALDKVQRNTEIRVLITTGCQKFYSNGIDISWVLENISATQMLKKFSLDCNTLMCRLLTFGLPTVAVINGHAFAGGAFLALCHDFIIMTEEQGWFSLNEIFLQIPIGDFFMALLKAKVSDSQTRSQLLLFGHRFCAQEAYNKRIITTFFQKSALMDKSKQFAENIITKNDFDKETLTIFKEDLYHSVLDQQKNTHKRFLGAKL